MAQMKSKGDLSLKWLDSFQSCARNGSLQAAAREMGLSVSTVSYHLRCLEDHLGIDLFNHSKRPMVLTPKGRVFLHDIGSALVSIRRAAAEASSGNLVEARYLRIGIIEDFESDIAPELAVDLSSHMPQCDFRYQTQNSHEIIDLLRNGHLDIGITTRPHERLHDLQDRPLLIDPFVLALPKQSNLSASDVVSGKTELPYLQFSSELIIAQQIAAQLRRLGMTLPNRFECASNQTLMAMVAAGAGWAITTPLLFSRARRFQLNLQMHPFPAKKFSRTLSLVTTPDCAGSIVDLVEQKLRDGLTRHLITPFHRRMPWLDPYLRLID